MGRLLAVSSFETGQFSRKGSYGGDRVETSILTDLLHLPRYAGSRELDAARD
jgi:hypothetical protein